MLRIKLTFITQYVVDTKTIRTLPWLINGYYQNSLGIVSLVNKVNHVGTNHYTKGNVCLPLLKQGII